MNQDECRAKIRKRMLVYYSIFSLELLAIIAFLTEKPVKLHMYVSAERVAPLRIFSFLFSFLPSFGFDWSWNNNSTTYCWPGIGIGRFGDFF